MFGAKNEGIWYKNVGYIVYETRYLRYFIALINKEGIICWIHY